MATFTRNFATHLLSEYSYSLYIRRPYVFSCRLRINTFRSCSATLNHSILLSNFAGRILRFSPYASQLVLSFRHGSNRPLHTTSCHIIHYDFTAYWQWSTNARTRTSKRSPSGAGATMRHRIHSMLRRKIPLTLEAQYFHLMAMRRRTQ